MIEINWREIPAGEVYSHTSPNGTGITRIAQRVSKFTISQIPVTNGQYQAFLEAEDGYRNRHWWNYASAALHERKPKPVPCLTDNPNLPRTNVCWWDALAFCRWMTVQTGQVVTLPTEHQWQLAATQGIDSVGVIEEWCLNDGSNDTRLDTGHHRVVRGGSTWGSNVLTARREMSPATYEDKLSFRLVLLGAAQTAQTTLEQILAGDNPLEMARALGEHGGIEVVEPLLKLLTETQDNQVAEATIDSLGLVRDERIVAPLLSIVRGDYPPEMHRAGILALAYNHQPQVIELFLQMLDYEKNIPALVNALIEIGSPVVEPLIGMLAHPKAQVRRHILIVLDGIGDQRAVLPLLKIMEGDDEGISSLAIGVLGRLGDAQVVTPLCEILTTHANPTLRESAALALGEFPAAVDHLIRALQDDNWRVQQSVVKSLGKLRDVQAITPLNDLLFGPQPVKNTSEGIGTRAAAMRALAQIGGDQAFEILMRCSQSPSSIERSTALEALGELNNPRVKAWIEKFLEDPVKSVQEAAQRALKQLV